MEKLKLLLESNSFRTLLSLLAIGCTVTFFLLNRKKKALSYTVVRNDELFRVTKTLGSRVGVTVDGNPVKGVSLVIVEVVNSGNESIKSDDFEKPLTMRFGGKAEIISARVLSMKPEDLGAVLLLNGSQVILEPLLLNKGDSLSIEVILTAHTEEISHTARVNGISEVKKLTGTSKKLWDEGYSATVAIGAGILIAVGTGTTLDWLEKHLGFWLPFSGVLILLSTLLKRALSSSKS